jgi:transposase-like protein
LQSEASPALGDQSAYSASFLSSLHSTIETKARSCGDTFYIDEVFVKINGKQHYVRRSVDGEVFNIYLQAKRDGVIA